VSSARNSVLARRHAALDTLLHGMPLGDVEDWARPARPMTRSELAELDSEPWQVWIDCLHMRIRHRTGRRPAAKTLHLASMPEAWPVLEALLGAPGRRLTWTRLQKSLALENEASARALALGLQRELHRDGATGLLRPGAHDCALHPGRFVHLHPAGRRPRTQALLLAHLAAQPGAPARVLRRLVQVPESTLQRHLQALRAQGLVRLAGGGREARYHCI
jgi:DNA-binding transcriptional ArsR family regulator